MIVKNFDIAHIDIIDTKLNYPGINQLKAEVFPFEEDEARTYIDDGRIIFACGIKMFRPEVGHCWVIPSVYIDNYSLSFYREIKKLIEIYSSKMRLRRLQTSVTSDFVKWIELLEFEKESTLSKIGLNGEDEFMYVKLFN